MTDKKTWGGARGGAGRPRSDSPLVRTSVGLTEKQRGYLRELGGGVVARGVRKAVDKHPDLLEALEQIERDCDSDADPSFVLGAIQATAHAAVAGARGKEVK